MGGTSPGLRPPSPTRGGHRRPRWRMAPILAPLPASVRGWGRGQAATREDHIDQEHIVTTTKRAKAASTPASTPDLEPARIAPTSASLRQARMPDDEDMHPDGSRVAFVVRDWMADQPKPVARIWTVPLDGGEARAITAGPGNDTHPRWSPDGQQLAFLSTRDGDNDGAKDNEKSGGKPQVYLMPAAGGTPRRLCTLPNGVESFAWSPDGGRLALLTWEGDEPGPKEQDPKVIAPDRHRRLWTVAVTS